MTTIQIHPDDLYFAVLEAPHSRGRNRTQELRYAFESLVPVEPGSLQTVLHTLRDKRVLAIGVPLDKANELGGYATAATPESYPAWLDIPTDSRSPSEINLLVGPSTPERVSRARRRTLNAALLIVAILAGVCSWGLERRIERAIHSTESAQSTIASLYQSALGVPSPTSSQPPAAILTAKLRELRSTRSPSPTSDSKTFHADTMLAGILSNWPDDAMLRTDSITLSPSAVEIAAFAESTHDTTKLIQSLQRIDGLEPATSSSTQQRGETRFQIRMRHSGSAP